MSLTDNRPYKLTSADIHSVRVRVSRLLREQTAVSEWGNCGECGGDLHPKRYTIACGTCTDRRRGLERRGAAKGITHRGLYV